MRLQWVSAKQSVSSVSREWKMALEMTWVSPKACWPCGSYNLDLELRFNNPGSTNYQKHVFLFFMWNKGLKRVQWLTGLTACSFREPGFVSHIHVVAHNSSSRRSEGPDLPLPAPGAWVVPRHTHRRNIQIRQIKYIFNWKKYANREELESWRS